VYLGDARAQVSERPGLVQWLGNQLTIWHLTALIDGEKIQLFG